MKLRYNLIVKPEELSSLETQLREELNVEEFGVPVTIPNQKYVDVRLLVEVDGKIKTRYAEQVIKAHKATMNGDPDPIGNYSRRVLVAEYFVTNWLPIIAAYTLIVATNFLRTYDTLLSDMYALAALLIVTIPFALAQALANIKIPESGKSS